MWNVNGAANRVLLDLNWPMAQWFVAQIVVSESRTHGVRTGDKDMLNPNGVTIDVATYNGAVAVPIVYHRGDWAVHRPAPNKAVVDPPKVWTVTHIPSGRRAGTLRNRRKAERACDKLATIPPLFLDTDGLPLKGDCFAEVQHTWFEIAGFDV